MRNNRAICLVEGVCGRARPAEWPGRRGVACRGGRLCLAAVVIGLLGGSGRGATAESPGPADFLTAQELRWLETNRTSLVVARDPRWYPSDTVGGPEAFTGITADFVRILEEKLGVTFQTLDAADWDEIARAESEGRIDIHPAHRQTAGRSNAWLFTEPYIRIPMMLLVNKSMTERLTLEGMRGMRIATGRLYGIDEFMREQGYRNLVPVKSDLDGLLDLSVGDLDIMVLDLATAAHYIEREGLTNLKIAGRIGPSYDFRIASRRDKPILHAILQKALDQVTDDERAAVYRKWVKVEAPPFYRSRAFWLFVSGGTLAAGFVIVLVLVWNKSLKTRVARTTQQLVQELAERRRTEAALSRARSELEQRVFERTAELATANRRLEGEMAERKQMEKEVLDIGSRERQRIGRDLHDSLGQELAAIACFSAALARRMDESVPEEAQSAGKIASLVEGAIARTRYIVRGLLPVDIEEEGLSFALRRLAGEIRAVRGVDCLCVCEEPCLVRDNVVATNLYRIAQEAVNNAIRHGSAQRIEIGLQVGPSGGRLAVRDNGTGIPAGNNETGMGLRIMRYRAELANGSLTIDRIPEGGTQVTCLFHDRASGDGSAASAGKNGTGP